MYLVLTTGACKRQQCKACFPRYHQVIKYDRVHVEYDEFIMMQLWFASLQYRWQSYYTPSVPHTNWLKTSFGLTHLVMQYCITAIHGG